MAMFKKKEPIIPEFDAAKIEALMSEVKANLAELIARHPGFCAWAKAQEEQATNCVVLDEYQILHDDAFRSENEEVCHLWRGHIERLTIEMVREYAGVTR